MRRYALPGCKKQLRMRAAFKILQCTEAGSKVLTAKAFPGVERLQLVPRTHHDLSPATTFLSGHDLSQAATFLWPLTLLESLPFYLSPSKRLGVLY